MTLLDVTYYIKILQFKFFGKSKDNICTWFSICYIPKANYIWATLYSLMQYLDNNLSWGSLFPSRITSIMLQLSVEKEQLFKLKSKKKEKCYHGWHIFDVQSKLHNTGRKCVLMWSRDILGRRIWELTLVMINNIKLYREIKCMLFIRILSFKGTNKIIFNKEMFTC